VEGEIGQIQLHGTTKKLLGDLGGQRKVAQNKAEQEQLEAAHVNHSKNKTTKSKKWLKGFLLVCSHRVSLDSTRTFREAPY
jgi:hypothetical protein